MEWNVNPKLSSKSGSRLPPHQTWHVLMHKLGLYPMCYVYRKNDKLLFKSDVLRVAWSNFMCSKTNPSKTCLWTPSSHWMHVAIEQFRYPEREDVWYGVLLKEGLEYWMITAVATKPVASMSLSSKSSWSLLLSMRPQLINAQPGSMTWIICKLTHYIAWNLMGAAESVV